VSPALLTDLLPIDNTFLFVTVEGHPGQHADRLSGTISLIPDLRRVFSITPPSTRRSTRMRMAPN
jgi:hypothetical protein